MAESGYTYANITTATNTLLKGAPGWFHGIVVNSGTGTFTIVDTTVAACTGGVTVATSAATVAGQVYLYDAQMNNGLCITTAGTTNLTVTWR